jgi:hypothetical protein
MWIDGIARRNHRTDGGTAVRIAAPRPGTLVFEQGFNEVFRYERGVIPRPHFDVLGLDGPVRAAVGAMTGDLGRGLGYSLAESALRRLIRAMRATASGAILAMMPSQPDAAILSEVRYHRADHQLVATRVRGDRDAFFAWVSALMADTGRRPTVRAHRAREAAREARERASEALEAAIDDLARLSAIDGAVLAGPALEVYGSGYIIRARNDSTFEVRRALDIGGDELENVPAHYGARHSSAYRFAFDNPDGVAFVVSEDGPVSCAMRRGNEVIAWPVRVSET